MNPFFDALVRYETELWNLLERGLADDDRSTVSLAQLESLRVIDRHSGSGRVQEISTELAITVGAASKLVDRLERDGLVLRRPNPNDRRSALVALTDQGSRALEGAERVASEILEGHLAPEEGSGPAVDVAALTASLLQLRSRLATAADLVAVRA
jgi:DNA-binding MarR family transcriptional regulator